MTKNEKIKTLKKVFNILKDDYGTATNQLSKYVFQNDNAPIIINEDEFLDYIYQDFFINVPDSKVDPNDISLHRIVDGYSNLLLKDIVK